MKPEYWYSSVGCFSLVTTLMRRRTSLVMPVAASTNTDPICASSSWDGAGMLTDAGGSADKGGFVGSFVGLRVGFWVGLPLGGRVGWRVVGDGVGGRVGRSVRGAGLGSD